MYFTNPDIGEELVAEMEKNLRKNAYVRETSYDYKKVEAIELLASAAQDFENTGLTKEAEAITRVVEYISNHKPERKLAVKKAQLSQEEPTADKNTVKKWMRMHLDEYTEGSGEINYTKMVEDAAMEFDLYEGEDAEIPEWVFETATEFDPDGAITVSEEDPTFEEIEGLW